MFQSAVKLSRFPAAVMAPAHHRKTRRSDTVAAS